MKLSHVFFFTLFCIAGGALAFYFFGPMPLPAVVIEAIVPQTAFAAPAPRTITSAPPPKETEAPVASDTPECEPFWRRIRTLNLEEFGFRKSGAMGPAHYSLKDIAGMVQAWKEIPVTENCRALPPGHPAAELHRELVKSCGAAQRLVESIRPDGVNKDPAVRRAFEVGLCFHRLEGYADFLRDQIAGKAPFDHLSDPTILISVVRGPLLEPNGESFGRRAAAAERLLQLDPKNVEAAEALARNRMFQSMFAGHREVVDEKLVSAVDTLEKVDPRNGYAADVRVHLAKTRGDRAAVEELAQELARDPKRRELGLYYQAMSAHLARDVAKAEAHLLQLLEANPGHLLARRSLEKLRGQGPQLPGDDEIFVSFASVLSDSL